MELYDWLLALHVLSAFVLAAALVVLWVTVLATRPGAELVEPAQAGRLGRVAGPLAAIGGMGTIVFGVWLAVDLDGYDLLDGWILASLVLWLIGTYTGERSGREFARGPEGRSRGLTLHVIASVAVLVILILMIWKPGA